MEIRCKHCQHVGPAAAVTPGPQGIMLTCEHCGKENLLEVGASAGVAPPRFDGLVAESLGPEDAPGDLAAPLRVKPAAALPEMKKPVLTPKAMARLVPEYGDGLRCRKCAHKLRPEQEHCSRCGLDVEDSFRYAEGEAPWELAPKGQDEAFSQAMLLWSAAQANWNEETSAKFAHFSRDHGFHEVAIRKLRFFLVDHPDDAIALVHLQELAMKMQSRLIVVRAQAEVSAGQLSSGLKRTRKVLLWLVVVVWVIIFILFLVQFMDNRGV